MEYYLVTQPYAQGCKYETGGRWPKGINTAPDLFGQFEEDKTLPYLAILPNTVTLGIEKKNDERSLGRSIFSTLSILDVGMKGRQPLNRAKQITSAWLIEAVLGTPRVIVLGRTVINLLPQKGAWWSHKYFTKCGVASAFLFTENNAC